MRWATEDLKEAPILKSTDRHNTAQPLDLETLLLLYFDAEDLADLTRGELHLLAAVCREDVDEPEGHAFVEAEDILERVRRKLTYPKARKEEEQPFQQLN